METRQMILGLPHRTTFDREDFMVAKCNREAVQWIDRYPKWPAHVFLICGPKGCGKTHLSHIFSGTRLDATELTDSNWLIRDTKIVLENVDKAQNEQALFHFYNWTKEQGISVLMTAEEEPHFALPDLESRMSLVPRVFIAPPDEELMFCVLFKAFHDRGIAIEPAVLDYIVRHIERSFPALQTLIDAADKMSLAQSRKITISVIKQVMDDLRVSQPWQL